MAYSLHEQYLDLASGFHVIELRDERGNQHFLQIAVGHEACVACGHVTPKDLDGIDPKAAVAEVSASLNKQQADMLAYAAKHGLKVK